MKKSFLVFRFFFLAAIAGLMFSAFDKERSKDKPHFKFPYKQSGLTERQAAAHLLSRFSFGATPRQVDAVIDMGLEKWFAQQLEAKLPDDSLNIMLDEYETLKMSNEEIVKIYPRNGQVAKMAVKEGFIERDSLSDGKGKFYKSQIKAYMDQNGLKPQKELFRQLINQKILRAVYSNNQLQELLTDFWFNHFNVSLTKNDCARFITVYERDAIRPNVLGKFETLLMATAKSPAMLTYLDNAKSSVAKEDATPKQKQQQERVLAQLEQEQMTDTGMQKINTLEKIKKAKKTQGLNENYAREIMELHTLGVDGGYTQTDVTQAAKVLTGWTVYPMGENGKEVAKKLTERMGEDRFAKQGFVREGDFLFAANKHDKSEKIVMGNKFPEGGGYEEGVKLIDMLAHAPGTAKFICIKLARRFVSDDPPQTLIDKMVKTFTEKDGDIKQVLITMATSPEFWSKEALREKTKSPFELVVSAVRSLDADVKMPYQLYTWVNKMGENLYSYQAPTGFPDKGQYWINTGSLLYRMNFGLALATQRIPGVSFNLAALNNNREPESAEAALVTYGKLLMPERNIDETVKRLTPLLNDPELVQKVNDAIVKTEPPPQQNIEQVNEDASMMMNDNSEGRMMKEKPVKKTKNNTIEKMQTGSGNNSMLAQVVGIIIGSPEFQRK